MCKIRNINTTLAICAIIVLSMMSSRYVLAADTTSKSNDDQAQKVYKTLGPDGEVIYSDKPTAGSKEVTVPAGGSYKPVPPPAGFTPYQAPPRTPVKKSVDNSVTITNPSNEQTIRSAPGELSVSVSLASGLGPGQILEYQIDGKTVYSGSKTSLTLNNIYRGTHVLTVRVTDESGGSVTSQPVTFFMKRPFKKK